MNLELRDERKKKGYKRFLNSFKYSLQGLVHTIREEQSILVMLIATIIAIILGVAINISPIEWIFVFLSIGLVLAVELLNTAIEATVDLVTLDIHPLAKIAKDAGSAAVFVCSVMAFVIGCFIFIPRLLVIIEMWW